MAGMLYGGDSFMEELLDLSRKELEEYHAHAQRLEIHLVDLNQNFISSMHEEAEEGGCRGK